MDLSEILLIAIAVMEGLRAGFDGLLSFLTNRDPTKLAVKKSAKVKAKADKLAAKAAELYVSNKEVI